MTKATGIFIAHQNPQKKVRKGGFEGENPPKIRLASKELLYKINLNSLTNNDWQS
jgi:hypothetical protein